jgi:hypothetical protein
MTKPKAMYCGNLGEILNRLEKICLLSNGFDITGGNFKWNVMLAKLLKTIKWKSNVGPVHRIPYAIIQPKIPNYEYKVFFIRY